MHNVSSDNSHFYRDIKGSIILWRVNLTTLFSYFDQVTQE